MVEWPRQSCVFLRSCHCQSSWDVITTRYPEPEAVESHCEFFFFGHARTPKVNRCTDSSYLAERDPPKVTCTPTPRIYSSMIRSPPFRSRSCRGSGREPRQEGKVPYCSKIIPTHAASNAPTCPRTGLHALVSPMMQTRQAIEPPGQIYGVVSLHSP